MNNDVVIDERLIADALLVTGLENQQEVIELGLKMLINLKKQEKIKEFKGRLKWEGDLDKM